MENLDSRLLRNQEEESGAARKLREERRSSFAEATEDKGEEAINFLLLCYEKKFVNNYRFN
ncbi:hypothetical protein HY797_02330 [Candidatus Falkowbacteria bacterium]|nr:hypothetical protein [Candidatus Falkowbacteria bacterium]